MPPRVRPIVRGDFDAVVAMLGRAFDDDPWFNFVAAQDARREERLRAWLRRGLTRKTFPFGETYTTDDYLGAALWIPAETASSHWWDELELRYALLRVSGPVRRRVREAIRLIQQNEPPEPHVELRIIGVDPRAQRTGIAAALMLPMLDRCDATGTPIALECTKERNIAFYEHFGFTVRSQIAIPDGPHLWGMWREPGR